MHRNKVQATARVISDLGSPSVVATLFLIGLPLLHPQVSWGHALIAATFVTLIPTLALIVMQRRGVVGDRHVTNRSQRAPIMIVAGLSILGGFVALAAVNADVVLFFEVGGILLGLIICFVITMFWKVSIHCAVATYVGLAATATAPLFGPVVALLFSSLVGWSRLRISHHTPSQVLAGQIVGCAVYLARAILLALV